MKKVAPFFEHKIKYFKYYYSHLGYRIFVAIKLNIVVGILDGFGLAMFLPLLDFVADSGSTSTGDVSNLGKLAFIPKMITGVGLEFNIVSVLIFLCFFFVLKGIVRFLSEAYKVIIQQYFIKNLRLGLIDAFVKMSFGAFVSTDVGRIQNTLTGEVGKINYSYKGYFNSLQNLVLVIVYMSFAFLIDPMFAVLVSVGGGLTNLVYQRIYKKTSRASKKVTALSHTYEGLLIQMVSNFKYLKATGLLGKYQKKLNSTVHGVEHQNRVMGMLGALLVGAKEPLLIVVVSAVIIVQTQVIGASLGPILISLLFFYRALGHLMAMQNFWNSFMTVSGSLSNMTDFKKTLDDEKESEGHLVFKQLEEAITIEHLTFRYDDLPVLNKLNIKFQKNQTVAVVGESGSGKTTLVNILAGLLPATEGRTLVDKTDISELNVKTYQNRVGYITQEPVIFGDTIFNNVTFWAEETHENLDRFEMAVRQAAIYDFIQNQSQGKDTYLGNNGVNLSGGQKQRISIARELYKQIDLLIMDEATSALDSETENAIQENIDKLKGKYTMLVVAHRLSTVKNADRIILLNKGNIEHQGTFEELREKSTTFRRMVELQEF